MKEGLAYISKRTNQVRYASATSGTDTGITNNNPDEQWLQQVSIYYAKEEIKRGDPVSVTAVDNPGLAEDPNPYIEKTDSSKHTKCIGIALEYAKVNKAVHVQPFGKFIYDDSKSSDREHKFSDDISGSYSTLAGKVVYIGQEPGTFTIDFDQAYANGRNIIQVGVITDAPAKGSQHEYAIELQPEADGRGPLDSTQFEFEIGEKVVFEPNEIKVFAIAGTQNKNSFTAKITGNPPEGFILFEPIDGSVPTVYGNEYGTLSKVDQSRLAKYGSLPSLTSVNSQFTGKSIDYNIYISSKARNYVSITVLNRPQPAETGKAVLAHAGFGSRSQIIGVYKNGSESKTFEINDTIKLIKQGIIKNAGLQPGKKYYLTDQGNIELTPNPVYDILLVVGNTNNKGDLIVDCHNSVNAHAGIKPVGYIKPLEDGQLPEYGYLAMNSTYEKKNYIALCSFLERCGASEFTLNGDNFTLNKPGYQIKFVDDGYTDTSIPRIPYLKLAGTFSNIDSTTTLGLNPQVNDCALAINGQGYDISSLACWSPMGVNGTDTDVNLSSFDIHLGVELNNEIVEIYPGFHQYESNTYGFNWKIVFDNNKYILTIDTGDEGNFGIAYIADPKTAPTMLNGKKYEIYVSRRDAGYTSLDLVNSVLQLTRQDFDPNSTLPVSGKALSTLGFSSRLEAKKVLGASRAINPTNYGNLSGNFDFTDDTYKELLQDNTIASKALYEINSIIYKYKNDHENAKPFIGILIDQLRKIVENGTFDADHSILINDESNLKKYNLTDDQKNAIKKILDLLTNNKNSAQIASSSIGLLIKAAGETQKRLLNIESALFGRDYETLPDHDTQKGSDKYPDSTKISPLPAQIGITRLVNALSKETLGSDNPTGNAANPDNSSNNNRIKDLYKQIEGTNGNYGEAGIELNLLTGKDNSFINDDQKGTGAIHDTSQISKGTLNTYPAVDYGTNGTVLTVPNGFDYNNNTPLIPSQSREKYKVPLKGINDALNRVMYKLNMLTSEIHGYDDILSKPVRLNNIRERLNKVVQDSYVVSSGVKALYKVTSYTDDNITETDLPEDTNKYDPNFTPDIINKTSLKDLYFDDLYKQWNSNDKSTSPGFKDNSGSHYRSSIIELIKQTLGNPIKVDDQNGTGTDFNASRNKINHSSRLNNLETAVDTIIGALFKGQDDPKITDNYNNINTIIGSTTDANNKADITRIQTEWKTNDGFKTLNQLIYDSDIPNNNSNIIQTIIRELTGNSSTTTSDFTTSTPTTFIDIFKKFLIANHYNLTDNSVAASLKSPIAADEIFTLKNNGIFYKETSVLNNVDLKERNIFYAKASESLTADTDNFVKSYIFNSKIVYQFYRDGNKFGLVNDYNERALQAGESITIHGQNPDACVTITAAGDGNLDITADKVSSIVIPTATSNIEPGALYIKE